MIRILIADDHRLVRDGLRACLEREKDMVIVGQAHDGAEVVRLVHQLYPDVVLLDIQMPKLTGLEAARELQSAGIKIIIVSMLGDKTVVQEAIALGVKGYLTKDEGFREVVAAVRSVHAGQTYYSQSVAKTMAGDAGNAR